MLQPAAGLILLPAVRTATPTKTSSGKPIKVCLQLFLHFLSDLMTGQFNFGDISQVKVIITVKQFRKKTNSFMVIPSKTTKSNYFFPSHLFTFHLLPVIKLNGIQAGAWLKSSCV